VTVLIVPGAVVVMAALVVGLVLCLRWVRHATAWDDAPAQLAGGPPMSDDELTRQLARVGSDLRFRRWVRNIVRVLAVFIALDLLVSVGTVTALVAVRAVQVEACHRSASDRDAVRDVVDIATAPTNGPVDLTKIIGFDQLDEPTQSYLRNLSLSLSRANPPGQP
jgi:hypothetical protein